MICREISPLNQIILIKSIHSHWSWRVFKSKSLSEVSSCSQTGGKAVIVEKSVRHGCMQTTFNDMLINSNPLFANDIPIDLLPHNISEIMYELDHAKYFCVVEFTKSSCLGCKFDLPLPGSRGGSFNSRFFGQIEGLVMVTKNLAIEAIKKSNKSAYEWLVR